jgi:hypothetical protein
MSASIPTPPDHTARGEKLVTDKDETVRMEVCAKCQRDRMQTVQWNNMGFDPVLDVQVFNFTLRCPDCEACYTMRVDGGTAGRFNNVMHNATDILRRRAEDIADEIARVERSIAFREINRLIDAIHNDYIVPLDF